MREKSIEDIAYHAAAMLAYFASGAGVEEHELPQLLTLIIRDLQNSRADFEQNIRTKGNNE
jgi:hypothetical protein